MELAELESIYRGLHASLIGRYVGSASFFVNNASTTPVDIDVHLGGRRVYYIFRTGRHIVLGLINRNISFLVFEVTNLSQLYVVVPDKLDILPHTRSTINLCTFHLVYNHTDDEHVPIDYFFDKVQLRKFLDIFEYGKDFLDFKTASSFCTFADRNSKKFESIGEFLLDERTIFGLGPYTVSEALYKSGILPNVHPSSIDRERWEHIFTNLKLVIEDSISHKGATLPDSMYVDAFNIAGEYQNHFLVYGKTNNIFHGIYY